MPHTFPEAANSAQIVGQPILAAAGFQPAFAEHEGSLTVRKSRLKAGYRQDCPPHYKCRISPM
jgi:hypothetical protein